MKNHSHEKALETRQDARHLFGHVILAVRRIAHFASALHPGVRPFRAFAFRVKLFSLDFLPGPYMTPLALNDRDLSDEDAISFGTAVNIAPIDESEDDWICISPYGEFPNDKGVQVIDRAAADAMVTEFNSVIGKLGRLFRGAPIFRGHPDARPDIWPDDVRYGRINELQARDDAFYGKAAWNDLGQKNKEQGYYVYPSPAWNFHMLGNGKIKPFRLKSLGLTNNPNIFESVPLTNASTTTSSAKTAESEQQKKESKTIMDKSKLIAALGLAADATDEQILTALNSRIEQAQTLAAVMTAINVTDRTKLQSAVTQSVSDRDAAINEAKKFKKLAIDHVLDMAINDGRLTAAERPTWASKLEENFDAGAEELKNKQKAINTNGLNLSPSGKDLSDPARRRISFNTRLDELMLPDSNGKGRSLDEAINAMRANDEDRALLAAMNGELKVA